MMKVSKVINVGTIILLPNTITILIKRYPKMLSMETEVTPYVLKTLCINLSLYLVLFVVLSTLLVKNLTPMIVVKIVMNLSKSKNQKLNLLLLSKLPILENPTDL